MEKCKIFVNADDFGINSSVNKAIIEAFEKKYINNTTIMTNMPGFDEAVKMAKEKNITDQVGLHLNFFEGKPLTEEMKCEPLFYDKDKEAMVSAHFLHEVSKKKWFLLPKRTRVALQREAEAQVKKYLAAGFTEMHFDSHGHSHTFLSVYLSIYGIMKKYGFKTTRKSLNLYGNRKVPTQLKRVYKYLFNSIVNCEFKTTNYFCNLDDFLSEKCLQKEKSYEIMTHPVYSNEKLINKGGNMEFLPIHCYQNRVK